MPETDLDLLIRVAREAGEIARGYFNGRNTVWDKGEGAGPVTEADIAVDTHLRETLLAARPDYGWLSEETEDDATRLKTSRVFIADPIDGTRAFVAGERTWSHSLAMVEDGVTVAGVVYLPMLDRLYSAARGRGSTLNGSPLRASKRVAAAGAEILAAKPAFDPRHWSGAPPPVNRNFRPSLAYRLALVGAGRFDGMLTLRDSWEWDIAAGSLIAAEAGAVVTDATGQCLRFNNPAPQCRGVIAAAPGVHRDILAGLREDAR